MKKYIFLQNAIELMALLLSGKRIEGALYIDKGTGRLTFKAYQRHRILHKDKLVKRLEHGWVKESRKRIKVYESVPKNLGMVRVMSVIDREVKTAKDALIDRELDKMIFG
jgi:hypothetical protein